MTQIEEVLRVNENGSVNVASHAGNVTLPKRIVERLVFEFQAWEQDQKHLADLYADAKLYRDQINRLVAKYGDGVRPSWVSTDISISLAYEKSLLEEAAKLERKI